MMGSVEMVDIVGASGAQLDGVGQARKRAEIRNHLRAGALDQAMTALRTMQQEFPETDPGQEMLDIAGAMSRQGRYVAAIELLEEIPNHYPSGGFARRAHFSIAEAYNKLGNETNMVIHYEAAAAPVARESVDRREVYASRRAVKRLGSHCMEKEKWHKALEWWEQFVPATSWCGTGNAGLKNLKLYSIAVCKINLGMVSEGLEMLESNILAQDLISPWVEIPLLFVEHHVRTGRLSELREKASVWASERAPTYGLKIVHEYLALLDLADKRDVAGLWGALDGHPEMWKRERVTELLVSLGDDTKAFATEKLNSATDTHRAIVFLGKLKAVEVAPKVVQLVRREQNLWMLGDYFTALLRMEDAQLTELVRQYALYGTGNHKAAAEHVLGTTVQGLNLDN
jgi:hypothetical protein